MINSNKKTLIICPPSMKQTAIEIESNSNSFNNVKIMSTNEVKENFFFSTNIETIIAICK